MRWRIFAKLGGSAFVKPLTGSRGDFAQAVHDEAALTRYLDEVAQYYDAILMQPIVAGNEYRIFLLDDEVLYYRAQASALCCGRWRAHASANLLTAHNDALRSRGLSPVCHRSRRRRSTPCWRKASAGRFPGG